MTAFCHVTAYCLPLLISARIFSLVEHHEYSVHERPLIAGLFISCRCRKDCTRDYLQVILFKNLKDRIHGRLNLICLIGCDHFWQLWSVSLCVMIAVCAGLVSLRAIIALFAIVISGTI